MRPMLQELDFGFWRVSCIDRRPLKSLLCAGVWMDAKAPVPSRLKAWALRALRAVRAMWAVQAQCSEREELEESGGRYRVRRQRSARSLHARAVLLALKPTHLAISYIPTHGTAHQARRNCQIATVYLQLYSFSHKAQIWLELFDDCNPPWCLGQNKRIAPLSFFHGCRKRRLKD
jgi:hypothetical protein